MNKKRDELQNKVAFSIRNVNIMMRRLAEKSPAKKQVDSATGMHGYVMCYLSEHEGEDVFQRDVEKKFSIRRSTATSILQLMEKNGLIERKSVQSDARLKKIVLTEKGKQLCDVCEAERIKNNGLLCSKLTDDEMQTLISILDKMWLSYSDNGVNQ